MILNSDYNLKKNSVSKNDELKSREKLEMVVDRTSLDKDTSENSIKIPQELPQLEETKKKKLFFKLKDFFKF